MAFSELSEVIEQYKVEISQNSAAEVRRQQIMPYSQIELSKLTQLFVPTISIVATYLETGDATQYRDYLTKLAEQRLASGFNVEEIVKVSRIMEVEMLKVVNREFADAAHDNVRQRYIHRVESTNMLANSIIITTRIKHGKS